MPQKCCFKPKKLAFFGQKKQFFGDGGSGTLDQLVQNTAKQTSFESSTLKLGYGALPVTTQAPKTLFWAKIWLFVAIFGQKMRFFLVMAALEPLTICSKTLQNTLC